MEFLITTITRVRREAYDDIFWSSEGETEVKTAPIAAFFEIATTVDNEKIVFEAEVRLNKFPQVDWADEFQDLLMTHSKSKEDRALVTNSIFSVYSNEVVNFPIAIGSF